MAALPLAGVVSAKEAAPEDPGEVIGFSKNPDGKIDRAYILHYGANFFANLPGEKVGCNGDDCAARITFDRPFPFYEYTFTSAYFSSNGLINFRWSDAQYYDHPSYLRTRDAIAPLWDDLHTGCTDTEGWFQTTGSNFQYFRYSGHPYGADECNTVNFEVFLYDNGLIRFGYGDASSSTSDSTTGIGGHYYNYCGYYDYYWYNKCPMWATYYESRDNAASTFFGRLSAGCGTDTVAPTASMSLAGTMGNDGWYKQDPVTVTISASDSSGADVWSSLNGAPATQYAGAFPVTVDGQHKMDYIAWDLCGKSDTKRSGTWKQDATSAVTTVAVGEPKFVGDAVHVTKDTPFSLSATDATSGVRNTFYSINGGDAVSYAGEFTIDGADGAYALAYWSEDIAGNIESATTLPVVLDNAAPIVDITKPLANTIESGPFLAPTGAEHSTIGWRYVQIAADIQDVSPVSTQFLIDGEVIATLDEGPWEITWDARGWMPGEHVITVRSTDVLGNVGDDSTTIVLLPGMTAEQILEAAWG